MRVNPSGRAGGRRRTSGDHLTGTGWWQQPANRRHATRRQTTRRQASRRQGGRRQAVDDTPRHRASLGIHRSRLRPARGAPRSAAGRRLLALRIALWSLAALVAAPVLAFLLGFVLFSVPDADEAVNNQVALVSYADGSELARLVPEAGNRTKVPLDAVPVPVRMAVLAAEDRSFYTNPGFDVTGIGRAVWKQLSGGAGGGSTITQQYVKKTLVGDDRSLWRKYRELVVAVRISQERTKDQILGDYLNAIYFGRGAYGIQAAAHAYFGKDVGALGPAEGALLAGLIQSPSRWDPALNPDKAVGRWNFVLDGMVEQGWLSPADRATAQFPATIPRGPNGGSVPTDNRGHIVAAATAELADLGFTEQDLTQGGLRITTTVDPSKQADAVAAVHDTLGHQPPDLRAALVSVDPDTGGLSAYYGGDNGYGLDYARVQRLAGSTFKPFVVLAGLLQDPPIGLGETFSGTENGGPRNAEGADCARCDLKQAMTISNNVVFNALAHKVGPAAVAAAAKAAGIGAPLQNPTSRIALGDKEISAVDLASAYATFAAGGVWHPPHLVTSVTGPDGTVLYQAATDGERRFPERVARNVTEAMLDVAANDGLGLPGGRPVAAKTGTVQSRVEGQNNDAWIAGFTPSLAASVWVGTDQNAPIRTASGRPVEGKSLPGDMWHDYLVAAVAGTPVTPFAPFRPIGEPPSDRPPHDPPVHDLPARTAPPRAVAPPDPQSAPPAADPTTTAPPDPGRARALSAEPAAPQRSAKPETARADRSAAGSADGAGQGEQSGPERQMERRQIAPSRTDSTSRASTLRDCGDDPCN